MNEICSMDSYFLGMLTIVILYACHAWLKSVYYDFGYVKGMEDQINKNKK